MTLLGHHSTTRARDARSTARARAAYTQYRGDAVTRQREIEALPRKMWRDRQVFRIRCTGTSGKGEHDLWVPEATLWALIDLRVFRCPFHAHDPAKNSA